MRRRFPILSALVLVCTFAKVCLAEQVPNAVLCKADKYPPPGHAMLDDTLEYREMFRFVTDLHIDIEAEGGSASGRS